MYYISMQLLDSKIGFTPPKRKLTIAELISSLQTLVSKGVVEISEVQTYMSNNNLCLDSGLTPLSELWLKDLKKKVFHIPAKDLKFTLQYEYTKLNHMPIGTVICYYLFYLTVWEVHPEFMSFVSAELSEKSILTCLQDKLIEL